MLSIIIPAHNEELLLGRTLDALLSAGFKIDHPHEIIVVDDASTDRTAAIAEDRGVRVVHVNHRQIAATRNAGAREARGDMLLFVDADTIVNDTVLRAAIDAMSHGAVGGGCRFYFEGRLPLYGRIMQSLAMPLYGLAKLASGCFLFCKRDAFEAVGGFDEKLFAAEEAYLSRALHKQGKFVILRAGVLTSGRKLRTYSAWEVLRLFGGIGLSGFKSVRRREGLDLWYGKRREDPDEAIRKAEAANSEWLVELNGRPVALLSEPLWEDMFWESYKFTTLVEDADILAKLQDTEFWKVCESQGIRFRHKASSKLSEYAFPALTPFPVPGRLMMRGMHL
ncbi:glycosyl transferase family 2 [Roseimicrobium gellanilyticum]|uniref:Glycosyl transferase family 2 n=1 Tax=Roseimicrobium gellanilyticum TaxID=748857 RepID=A0A366H1R3_9BACT|nr:glycosyltransferase [Roseimicrobium gellanilyticum]RBP35708.1 glycosyl transferase family 2 [Roseimicrobium gellanilyticum]